MLIYVDIDNTICKTNSMDYKNAKPIKDNIDKINKLYDEGNTIVYWTARGTKTGINIWGCKFHELRMGKPNYDLFIDDKNLNAKLHFTNENILKLLS